MDTKLSAQDIEVILEALGQAKHHTENHQSYPSYEFKQAQLARIESATQKIRALRDTQKKGA
ncbi:MAG TPA: hypothetical protein VK539_29650 [Myxococcaceae bacterium]|jgi:signal recognition particle subunit SEC65|nr:hypothetical protein [Myxococcaceae bacterium]